VPADDASRAAGRPPSCSLPPFTILFSDVRFRRLITFITLMADARLRNARRHAGFSALIRRWASAAFQSPPSLWCSLPQPSSSSSPLIAIRHAFPACLTQSIVMFLFRDRRRCLLPLRQMRQLSLSDTSRRRRRSRLLAYRYELPDVIWP